MSGLIGGHFSVDVTRPLPDLGGGLPAYAATSQRMGDAGFLALRMDRFAPANALAGQLPATGIEGLALPQAHGIGPPIGQDPAYFVIVPAPGGEPLSANPRPWTETAIIEFALRPIARILEELRQRGLTHRAIRPNNVFQSAPNRPVTLGTAWAAPPAMHQPAVFETPASAMCHPAGRGSGRIADDIYALGVLLVTLSLGRVPMDGIPERTLIASKLDLGDFAAVTRGERLPPILTDLVRGMLAEDPDHRPPPALLTDIVGARGRRVAARPPSRAGTPIKLGAIQAWNSRTLAFAMASHPADAAASIQSGALMLWLRRSLGDAALAVRLEELVRASAQEGTRDQEEARILLVMRAIAAAEGLMPLCWGSLALFPDGLGPVLAAAAAGDGAMRRALTALIAAEADGIWAVMREDRAPASPFRTDARQRRSQLMVKGPAGGLPRVTYTANPMLPCLSPVLAGRWIAQPADLPAALDAAVAKTPDTDLLEPHIVAFIAARSDRWLDQHLAALANAAGAAERALSVTALFAALQSRHDIPPLKALAAWAGARAQPLVRAWRNKARRAEIEQRLRTLTEAGLLPPILTLLEDPAGRQADAEGLRGAIAELAAMDAMLQAIADGGPHRAEISARLGQEIAAGVGLAVAAGTLMLAALR